MRHSTHRLLGELYAAGLCDAPMKFVCDAVIERLEAIEVSDELDRLQVLEAIVALGDEVSGIDVEVQRAEYEVLNTKHRKALSRKRTGLLKHWGKAEL